MRGLHFLFLTLGALASFTVYVVVSSTDPSTVSPQLKTLFYGSLAIAITSLLVVLRIWLHPLIRHSLLDRLPIWQALRQAIIITLAIICLLLLQALRNLSWLDAGLILISALLFEMFFRVRLPVKQEKELV